MFLTEIKESEKRKESPLKDEAILQRKLKNIEDSRQEGLKISKSSANDSKKSAASNQNLQKKKQIPGKSNMSQTTSQKFSMNNTKERKSLLPSVHQNGSKSRASTSAIAQRSEKRFDNIKTIMNECKSAKKESRHSEGKSTRNPLITFYENKIVQNYDTIYKTGNPNKIMKELKRIEKRKFLEHELMNKQSEMEKDKAKFNQIQYEIKNKKMLLNSMQQNLEKLGALIGEESLSATIEEYEQEEGQLQNELEQMKFSVDSLSFVHSSRKKLVLQIKKMCSEHTSNLKFVETRTNFFSNLTEKRKMKCEEYSKKLSQYGSTMNPELLGPRFSEMLEDELSVFEETRAVKEIFRHENEIETEKERKLQQERKATVQKQKILKEKAFERTRREKRREEEILRDLKTSFSKIRKVTNVREISELPEHKLNLELGQKFFEELSENLAKEVESKKKENKELQEKHQNLLHETNAGMGKDEDQKMDDLEMDILTRHNHVMDLENSNSKLKKLISDVCVVTGRVLYQMQKDVNFVPLYQKSQDKEVKITNVVSSLSSMGLKLERLLNILSSFKTALNVESLNTDGTIENNMKNDIKKSLGLNSRVFVNVDPEMFEEDKDELFVYREDDPAEIENTEYLLKKRNKTKYGNVNKAKVKDSVEKINLKGIL